jgi:hypothetical protein
MRLGTAKAIAIFGISVAAALRFMMIFCDMRGSWAANVVDGCSVYARYLTLPFFGADIVAAICAMRSQNKQTIKICLVVSAILTFVAGMMIKHWTSD